MTDKNITFFNNNETYQTNVNSLDTYATIRCIIETETTGAKSLLDIGNGGFFNYDISNISRVVALDLFLDESKDYGANVTAIKGDALNFRIHKGSETEKFDTIIVQMLIHHLCGNSPEESLRNLDSLLAQCREHLSENGKLIIIESTVNPWFYVIEKFLFRLLNPIWFFPHPLVIQHTPTAILSAAKNAGLKVAEFSTIKKGKWVLQFGLLFPSALTPAQPIKLILTR